MLTIGVHPINIGDYQLRPAWKAGCCDNLKLYRLYRLFSLLQDKDRLCF